MVKMAIAVDSTTCPALLALILYPLCVYAYKWGYLIQLWGVSHTEMGVSHTVDALEASKIKASSVSKKSKRNQ